jgi:hypothetical protein
MPAGFAYLSRKENIRFSFPLPLWENAGELAKAAVVS